MKLTEIKIENYRGIKEEQTIPIGDLTTFVGKNDSGKSIVLYALATFLSKDFSITLNDFNNETKPISITATFQDDNIHDLILKHLKLEKDTGLQEFLDSITKDGCITIRKVLTDQSKKYFNQVYIEASTYSDEEFRDLYNKKSTELDKIIKTYGIEIPVEGKGNNSSYEKIKYISEYCNSENKEVIFYFIPDTDGVAQILPRVELFPADKVIDVDTAFKSESLSEIAPFFVNNESLTNLESQITEQLNQEASDIKGYLKDYVSTIEKVEMAPEFSWNKSVDKISIKLKCNEDSKELPLSHKGSGYRRLFMVARLRYLADREESFNTIYLIEEPETFLHPSAQEDLLEALVNLSEENQVLITTHSPVFASMTNKQSVILAKKEDQSRYTSIIDFREENDFIKLMVTELGIKPEHNPLEFSKVLFVEGKDDSEFFNIVSTKLADNPLTNNNDIFVLHIGGNNNLKAYVNIDYFSRSDKELFCILDSDKSLENPDGDPKQIERFNTFSTGGDNRSGYLLKRRCIENYYHPRAIERVYSLADGSLEDIQPTDNVDNDYFPNKVKPLTSQNLKAKGNLEIYNAMTTDELNEVIEPELVNFLKQILE